MKVKTAAVVLDSERKKHVSFKPEYEPKYRRTF